MTWNGEALTFDIDERTFPLPSRIRGAVRVYPVAMIEHTVALDGAGRHRWSPLAACARVEVELERPNLRWTGAGYFDSNCGDEPISRAFKRWTWSRAATTNGTVILYDVTRRTGTPFRLALDCDDRGAVHPLAPPPPVVLPRTGWGIHRETQADEGRGAKVLRTLEDTPFYARSPVETTLYGQTVVAMHESLSLDRIRTGWVPWLLPFRMPRAWR